MKNKDIEERFPRFFRFGKSFNGGAQIATPKDGSFMSVPEHQADNVIAERDRVIDMLVEMSIAFSVASPLMFDAIWKHPFPHYQKENDLAPIVRGLQDKLRKSERRNKELEMQYNALVNNVISGEG